MKRFIIQTILLVFPVLAVMILLECSLRNVSNDYIYKRDWMQAHSSEVKILNFGSSHTYFGIRPQFFCDCAFNLAFTSQSLKYDNFLYNQYALKCDSLRYIILPISYFTLRSDLEKGSEWWRAKGYCIYMGCTDHLYNPRYMLEITSKDKLKMLPEVLFGECDLKSCDEYGFGVSYKKEYRVDDWSSSGSVAAKRHTSTHVERVDTNIQYLLSIINSCKERGVNVLLLTTPVYYTYMEALDTVQLEEMISVCNRLDDNNEHVVYLNWLQHQAFTEDDFYDADHLNEYGAEKLTKMLDEYILSW